MVFGNSSGNLSNLTLQGMLATKRDNYGRLILGDIITSVNGKKVVNGSDLYRILDQCKVGEKVSSHILTLEKIVHIWDHI